MAQHYNQSELDTMGIPALTADDLIQWGFSNTAPSNVLGGYSVLTGGSNTLTVTAGGSGGSGGISYAGSPNITWASRTYTNGNNPNLTVEQSGKLHLAGKDPDILIGDMSLKETLASIQQQLGILQSNKGLEERWEKLRKIKEEYDACLADLVEKETIWAELKR